MAITTTRRFGQYLKQRVIGQDDFKIKLFSTYSTLSYNTVPTDVTELTTVGGYSTGGITLSTGNWTETLGDGSTRYCIVQPEVTFTFTSSGSTILGYYVTVTCDLGGGSTQHVLWTETGSMTVTGNGDKYKVTPRVEM